MISFLRRFFAVSACVIAQVACCETSYKDWYTPSGGFSSEERGSDIGYWDGGVWREITVSGINLNSGEGDCANAISNALASTTMTASARNAFNLAKAALAKSIFNELQSEKLALAIDEMANNIENIVITDAMETSDESGNSSVTFYKGKTGAVVVGGKPQGTVKKSVALRRYKVDNVGSDPSVFGLYENNGANPVGKTWTASNGHWVDGISITTNASDVAQIKDWSEPEESSQTIASRMTSGSDESLFLARSSSGTMEYVPAGDLSSLTNIMEVTNTIYQIVTNIVSTEITNLTFETVTNIVSTEITNLTYSTVSNVAYSAVSNITYSTVTNLVTTEATNLVYSTMTNVVYTEITNLTYSTVSNITSSTVTNLTQHLVTNTVFNVITNMAEGVLSTGLVERLDHKSVWTNSESKVEVMGYEAVSVAKESGDEDYPRYVPMKVYDADSADESKLRWERHDTYTNLLFTMWGFFQKLSQSGINAQPKPDSKVKSSDLLSIENANNVFNDQFDKTDVNNQFVKFMVSGDADKAPNVSGLRKLYSTEYLGDRCSAYGGSISLYDFWNAKGNSYPKVTRTTGVNASSTLEWEGEVVADSEIEEYVGEQSLKPTKSIEAYSEPFPASGDYADYLAHRRIFKLYHFDDADEYQIPFKMHSASGSDSDWEIGWTNMVGSTTFKTECQNSSFSPSSGETEVTEATGSKLVFRSDGNSNVKVNITTNTSGSVILTFGVYYK